MSIRKPRSQTTDPQPAAMINGRAIALRAAAPTLMGSEGTGGTRSVQIWAPPARSLSFGIAQVAPLCVIALFSLTTAIGGGPRAGLAYLLGGVVGAVLMYSFARLPRFRPIRMVTDAKGFAVTGLRGKRTARWSDVTRLSRCTFYVFPAPYLEIELGQSGDSIIRIPLSAFAHEKMQALEALIAARSGLVLVDAPKTVYERPK